MFQHISICSTSLRSQPFRRQQQHKSQLLCLDSLRLLLIRHTLFEKKFFIPLIWFYRQCLVEQQTKIHSLNALLYNELKLRNLLIRHKLSNNQSIVYSRTIKLTILRQYRYQFICRAVFNYLSINSAISFKHTVVLYFTVFVAFQDAVTSGPQPLGDGSQRSDAKLS